MSFTDDDAVNLLMQSALRRDIQPGSLQDDGPSGLPATSPSEGVQVTITDSRVEYGEALVEDSAFFGMPWSQNPAVNRDNLNYAFYDFLLAQSSGGASSGDGDYDGEGGERAFMYGGEKTCCAFIGATPPMPPEVVHRGTGIWAPPTNRSSGDGWQLAIPGLHFNWQNQCSDADTAFFPMTVAQVTNTKTKKLENEFSEALGVKKASYEDLKKAAGYVEGSRGNVVFWDFGNPQGAVAYFKKKHHYPDMKSFLTARGCTRLFGVDLHHGHNRQLATQIRPLFKTCTTAGKKDFSAVDWCSLSCAQGGWTEINGRGVIDTSAPCKAAKQAAAALKAAVAQGRCGDNLTMSFMLSIFPNVLTAYYDDMRCNNNPWGGTMLRPPEKYDPLNRPAWQTKRKLVISPGKCEAFKIASQPKGTEKLDWVRDPEYCKQECP
jgi:hypothetical protein